MKSGLRFVCTIAGVPADTFAVGEFSLQEGLSELFTLNLTLVRAGNANPFRPQTDIDLASLLMQEAVLQVFNGDRLQRKITGIISHADWVGTDGNKTLYILLAFEAIEAGDIAQGVVHLANHEQLNILQPTMYSDKLLVGLLRGNHFSYVTNIFSGVRNISESVELTLASQCRPVDGGRTISFSNNKPYANLADVNQRMPFVLKAAARFDEMLHDNNRSLLEKSLQDIAAGRGVE